MEAVCTTFGKTISGSKATAFWGESVVFLEDGKFNRKFEQICMKENTVMA